MPRPTRPRLLKRRVIYNGRIFRVELDSVQLANGRTAALEAVRHRGSVVLLAQPSPDRIILVRQYRYVIDRWIWELPAGSREPGERSGRVRASRVRGRNRPDAAQGPPAGGPVPDPRLLRRGDGLLSLHRFARPRARDVERDVDEQLEPRVFTSSGRAVALGQGADHRHENGCRVTLDWVLSQARVELSIPP